MSDFMIKNGNTYVQPLQRYVADSEADKDNIGLLGVPIGSTCYVIGTKKNYMLGNNNEWEEVENSGGGSDLPDITNADNGKVLTVVNGEWDKAKPLPEIPEQLTLPVALAVTNSTALTPEWKETELIPHPYAVAGETKKEALLFSSDIYGNELIWDNMSVDIEDNANATDDVYSPILPGNSTSGTAGLLSSSLKFKHIFPESSVAYGSKKYLATNGSGALSWETVSSGGGSLPYPEYSETGHYRRVLQTSGSENPPDVIWDDLYSYVSTNGNYSADILALCACSDYVVEGKVSLYGGTGGDDAEFVSIFPPRTELLNNQQGFLTVTHYGGGSTDELSWTNLNTIPMLPSPSQDDKILLATADSGHGTETSWITLAQLKTLLNALP